MEENLFPFVELEVTFYVQQTQNVVWQRLLDRFKFRKHFVIPELMPTWTRNNGFAKSIVTCEELDRICIIRMLTDFQTLPSDSYRLFAGTDIFFIKPPDELLSFCWSGKRDDGFIYMADVTTFRGQPYELSPWAGPLAKGLLGDFYCLPPGLTLDEQAIRNCLRLIDTWPLENGRYKPSFLGPNTQVEQMAAAVLLGPHGGRILPTHRYSHGHSGPYNVVIHSHELDNVKSRLSAKVLERLSNLQREFHDLLRHHTQKEERSKLSPREQNFPFDPEHGSYLVTKDLSVRDLELVG